MYNSVCGRSEKERVIGHAWQMWDGFPDGAIHQPHVTLVAPLLSVTGIAFTNHFTFSQGEAFFFFLKITAGTCQYIRGIE